MAITREALDLGASLAQAMRYVNAWKGRTVVAKYGGSVMSAAASSTLFEDLVLLSGAGVRTILVHGGGAEITRLLERLGKRSRFVGGLRVTDDDTMEAVEMVLGGRANKTLVALIAKAGGRAVGISGKDAQLLRARKVAGEVDLGWVGEVERVDPAILDLLTAQGYIPVVASLGIDEDGAAYNLNADHAAGEIAAALGASKLIVLTDVDGIYRDLHGDRQVIPTLSKGEARQLLADGAVSKGMIPKLEACLRALDGRVASAHVINGDTPHALLVELLTEQGIGTMITP